jgi:cytochrome c553
MSGMASPLSEQDMHDLAAWFASQKSGLVVKQ